ncbi:hypothetical protein B0H14DRAFT_2678522 [Mycena olivaceomarginata]|nr:hypothetical protein B0H14DRAFT_2678522 [Mycena olivaceomarginata]
MVTMHWLVSPTVFVSAVTVYLYTLRPMTRVPVTFRWFFFSVAVTRSEVMETSGAMVSRRHLFVSKYITRTDMAPGMVYATTPRTRWSLLPEYAPPLVFLIELRLAIGSAGSMATEPAVRTGGLVASGISNAGFGLMPSLILLLIPIWALLDIVSVKESRVRCVLRRR